MRCLCVSIFHSKNYFHPTGRGIFGMLENLGILVIFSTVMDSCP
jgi:hypothetical protein